MVQKMSMFSILITIPFNVPHVIVEFRLIRSTQSEIRAKSFVNISIQVKTISERLISIFLTIKLARTLWQKLHRQRDGKIRVVLEAHNDIGGCPRARFGLQVVEQHLLPHPHFLHLQISPPTNPKSLTLRLTPHRNPTHPRCTEKKLVRRKGRRISSQQSCAYITINYNKK